LGDTARFWAGDGHKFNICSAPDEFPESEKSDIRAKEFEFGGGVARARISELDAIRELSATGSISPHASNPWRRTPRPGTPTWHIGAKRSPRVAARRNFADEIPSVSGRHKVRLTGH
jgi:hypothetical protein